MRSLINKQLNGKKILLFFTITTFIYLLMILYTIPLVMNFSGGSKLLDMMPMGYDIAYVNSLLIALGEEGRDAYLYKQIPLDMVYPAFFGVSYCLILAYFLNKLSKLESALLYLCLLPLFAGLFDYLENIGIITLLITYPDHTNIVAQATNVFSVLKSLFTSLYFISLMITLIMFGLMKLLPKKMI